MPIDLATDNSPSPEHRPDLKKVRHAGAHALRQGPVIDARNRLKRGPIHRIIELKHSAVHAFPRVRTDRRAHICAGSQSCSQNEQGKQTLFRKIGLHLCHGRFLSEADVSVADFAPPAPAALLYRNWLTRFSSTIADCVIVMVPPGGSICSSLPGVMPIYCSPSRPAVRIFAELSRGN